MPEEQQTPEDESEHKEENGKDEPVLIDLAQTKNELTAKEETIETNLPAQNDPLTPQSSKEGMEVHHHTHTERKKWKHYIFEFFMLFLAVFCGYLAEYQLEHKIEKDRERQFMASMVEDLKSDKFLLYENIDLRKNRDKLIDSFILLLSDKNFVNHGNKIYYAGCILTLPLFFVSNDRTIQQLKFSGGLRLIRNTKVSDSIMSYYQLMQQLAIATEDEQQIRGNFRNYAGNVFDGRVFFSMQDKNSGGSIYIPAGNPQLLRKDAATINELIIRANYIKTVQMAIRKREEKIREIAIQLMAFIKKEYRLKNE